VPVCRLARGDAAPSPVPPHRPRRYPSDTTDAEWALLQPLLPHQPRATARAAGQKPTIAATSSTPSVMWPTTAASGGPCPPISRPGAPCTGSTGAGTPAAPPPGCTISSVLRFDWPRAVAPSQPRRSSTPNRCAPPTPCLGKAAAMMPPRRSTGENATLPSTPWGCCWRSWSPPPASKTATAPGRTVRDYERLPAHHQAMVQWAMITIMTRRLARRQGPARTPTPALTKAA
jgi:hypothetical protein